MLQLFIFRISQLLLCKNVNHIDDFLRWFKANGKEQGDTLIEV